MTFALVALLALTDPQAPAREPQSIVIDAIVFDARGRNVDTLKVQDFELRDDGAVSTLDEVRYVRDEPRRVAIYLDEYHVSPGAETDRVRAALTAFIDHDLGPNDQIVVMKPLDSVLKIELTRDHAAARAIVAAFEGRSGEYAPRNDYEREFIAGTPARVEAARTQVGWSALNALAVNLGTHGRQRSTLVLVSDTLSRLERRRRGEALPSVETVLRSANRSNVAVYAVDPSDAADVAPSDAMRRLTTETDGQFITGDLAQGLRRALADSGGYYLLSYHVSHPVDGSFHEVQIRVKRAGMQLHSRKGYFSPSPEDQLRAALLARINAPKPVVPPEPMAHASPLIHPWFGWARGDGGKTRVTFVWEPVAAVPGDRKTKAAARLVFTALTSDGKVLYEGPVLPTGPGTLDEPGAVPSRAVFETPPGRIKLRMAIEDVASQVIDRDVRDVVVRDLKGSVAIGTPQVMRARNARELRTLDQAAVPVVSRDFSRAEELLVRVPVYGSNGEVPTVSARLLNRAGQSMRDLTVSSSSADGVEAFAVPLAGLAIGNYSIEVKATDASGEAKDRIDFRVTP